MSGRRIIVSAHEMSNGAWYGKSEQTARVKNAHNGTELRDQLGTFIKLYPGGTALGDAILALPDLPAVSGYNGQATRHWSIESTGNDTHSAKASIVLTSGEIYLEDNELNDFESEPFDTLQEAASWVAGKLGHADLVTQIEGISLAP